jgi:hypothetical protein
MKPSEQPPPCRRNDRNLWFGGDDDGNNCSKYDAAGIAMAVELCHSECPLSSFERCAREALRGTLDGSHGIEGVWAGVFLPGPTYWRKRPIREAGIEQLKRIAARDVSGAA